MERNEERIIDVVYSTQDMLAKIQEYRAPEGPSDHIYIFSNVINEFHALERDDGISLFEASGIRNKVREFFVKENKLDEGLRKLDLTAAERQHYVDILNKGGIILVTGFDPFAESPLSQRYHERHGPYHRHFENTKRGPLLKMLLGEEREPVKASYMKPTHHADVAGEFGRDPASYRPPTNE